MSSVPEDLYLDILLNVPAESLVICKYVCKSWFQIISNPNFVKMHLDINMKRKNYNLIFESYDERKRRRAINSISYDSLSSMNGSESEIGELRDYPFNADMTIQFLGSCNGLVCICYYTGSKTFICFFNPATKEYKRLKKSPYSCPISISAFGYDSKADDYMLIIPDPDAFYSGTNKFLVYRSGSKTWKRSQPVPYSFFPNKPQTGILVDGAFHWIGEARENYSSMLLIVVFYLSNEKFDELQLPNELLKNKPLSMTIGVLEECLCLLVTACEDRFDVWVMQDHAVHESWTRRYSFERELMTTDFNALKLMSPFRNGHILLWNGYKLFIHDPKHQKGRKPMSLSSLRVHKSVDYVGSLVSLNSGMYAGRNKMV